MDELKVIHVEFIGVCTHIQRMDGMSLPAPHRVILINSAALQDVNRHQAKLEIWEGDQKTFERDLDGERVSIAGALNGTVEVDSFYRCAVPHLLTDGFAESMTLSPRVTYAPNRALVAAMIDLPNGRLTAMKRKEGAVVAAAKVLTNGPRQLHLATLEGVPMPAVDIPRDAVVVLRNTASAEGEDEDRDFMLNFLIADPVPIVRRLPLRTCPGIPEHTRPGLSIGPGCSNTNFP